MAVKKASLDLSEADLHELTQEGQLMRRLRHTNVLPLHCAFVVGVHVLLSYCINRCCYYQRMRRLLYANVLDPHCAYGAGAHAMRDSRCYHLHALPAVARQRH